MATKERKTWVQEPHLAKKVSLPQRLIDKGQKFADVKPQAHAGTCCAGAAIRVSSPGRGQRQRGGDRARDRHRSDGRLREP